MNLLNSINSPADIKELSLAELNTLAGEIRERIIDVTSRNGGHVGPNLGVVELTIALHRAFNTPKDKFTFDVSHQGYVHKLLTGRNNEKFDKIRQTNGYAGFLAREESEHDSFGSGHAGTALSAALGMATARDRKGSDEEVVAICGDAAFTCGITMEALNNISDHTKKLIVILNDNEWSISENVGAIPRYFNELITNPYYKKLDKQLSDILPRLPGGKELLSFAKKWKRGTKDFFVPTSGLFETYNLRYLGPIDGHDIELLERYLEIAKDSDEPVVLHIKTTKGYGYPPALKSPEKFHGGGPFDKETGTFKAKAKEAPLNYQDAFGLSLLRYAEQDQNVIGITAAMPPGTGLVHLRSKKPEQFFDVGIAEEHAVIFAAGMATQGFSPVVAIYSTFLQRAIDPIIHDVCLQNLPVTFCLDRAGLSPNDGATHHGLYDISYLRCIPNATLMQPKDEDELSDMLWTSIQMNSPCFIRYPRGAATGKQIKKDPSIIEIAKAEKLIKGQDVSLWAIGSYVQESEEIIQELKKEGVSASLTNARFIKPLDDQLLLSDAQEHKLIVTLEDHALEGGFGSAILESLSKQDSARPVLRIAWPDEFIGHASNSADLREKHGISKKQIVEAIITKLKKL